MWRNLAASGSMLPWLFQAGTRVTTEGKELWYVVRHKPYLSISLRRGLFQRIALTTERCQEWVERINNCIAEN